MSQPIFLFNKDGEEVVLYAPIYAREQVEAGILFEEKPEPKSAPKRKRGRPRKKV